MKYVLSLILLVSTSFGAWAGSSHHNTAANNTVTAAAVATGGASAVGGDVIALPSGTAGGLSNGYRCAVSNSVTLGPIGWAVSSVDDGCLKAAKAEMACRYGPGSAVCAHYLGDFLSYEPAKPVDVDTAAE